jgi:hypothetical protein
MWDRLLQINAFNKRGLLKLEGVKTFSNSISKLIRRNPKIIKNETTKELLGCSLDELKIHIEKQFSPGMSWDNYNNKTWHIDHIRPISLAKTMKDVISLKLMHYTNFQPLWAKDNILKSNKYNEKI